MEFGERGSPTTTALIAGGLYAVFGVLWIVFSDSLVQSLAGSQRQLTLLQTYKGVGFVVVSAVFVFVLVRISLARIVERNRRLQSALRQAGILHRILRHNLRNSCNVIAASVSALEEGRTGTEAAEHVSRIETQTSRLLSVSSKSRYLRDFLDESDRMLWEQDLVTVVARQVESASESHEDAVIETDLPPEARVDAHYHVGAAVLELLDNAIVHNRTSPPRVSVAVQSSDDSVVVSVSDNGQGMPRLERRVLDQELETPTEHSRGIGLWFVRFTAEYSGGSISIDEASDGGTNVRLRLPAESATGGWLSW